MNRIEVIRSAIANREALDDGRGVLVAVAQDAASFIVTMDDGDLGAVTASQHDGLAHHVDDRRFKIVPGIGPIRPRPDLDDLAILGVVDRILDRREVAAAIGTHGVDAGADIIAAKIGQDTGTIRIDLIRTVAGDRAVGQRGYAAIAVVPAAPTVELDLGVLDRHGGILVVETAAIAPCRVVVHETAIDQGQAATVLVDAATVLIRLAVLDPDILHDYIGSIDVVSAGDIVETTA